MSIKNSVFLGIEYKKYSYYTHMMSTTNPIELFRSATKGLIDDFNVKQVDLAKAIDIPPNRLNDYLKGRINFSEKKRMLIAEFFDMSYIDILVFGDQHEEKDNTYTTPKMSTKNNPIEIFREATKRLISIRKVSQVDIATHMKVKPGAVNDYIKGRTNFSEKKRMLIANFFNMSYIDMLLFENDQYEKTHNGYTVKEPDPEYSESPADGKKDPKLKQLMREQILENQVKKLKTKNKVLEVQVAGYEKILKRTEETVDILKEYVRFYDPNILPEDIENEEQFQKKFYAANFNKLKK